ncbi:MAG: NACHT domain-containing protein [Sodalinema sp.]|uniref:NACHT domain-containing protein n=1 Tax=Sodalinema sp. TaxID=3080550 RepID=UPI001216BB6C|nr:MAG: NACHT domain-containing protein [Phormidium sp. SL48-SHIP]
MGGDYQQQGINPNDAAQVNISQMVQNFGNPTSTSRDASEAKLLKAVKNEVAGRFSRSLHHRVYLELDKAEDPSQVIAPWSVDVKLGHAPHQQVCQNNQIIDTFDRPDIGGRLLILGSPGSGKTTVLLQLAQTLVERAEKTATDPVPVLLNLSAWNSNFKDIRSWIILDLKLKYGIRQDIARKWLDRGRILPLLDGLDELMSQCQETCIESLNQFLPDWSGMPLVVCCRLEEYQLYNQHLGLNGALILQPLSDSQIQAYLQQAKCDWLWQAIRHDSDIMNPEHGLARSPLFLTILVLASDNLPPEIWKQSVSPTQRREVLFEAYIQTRLQRRYLGGANLAATRHGQKPYQDDEQTKHWLGWLASRLIEENQTEFFIEKLQPYFLLKRPYKLVYGLVVGLVLGIVVGLVFSLIYGVIDGLLRGLLGGLAVGLIVGLVGGLIREIKTVETIRFSRKLASKQLSRIITKSLFLGWVVGLMGGITGGLIGERFGGLWIGVLGGIVIGQVFGTVVGVIGGLVEALVGGEIDTKKEDNQGIYRSLVNSFIFGFMFVPVGFLIPLSIHYLNEPVGLWRLIREGIVLGFLFGAFAGGLNSVISHFALRVTLWLFGYSPWNYSKFLRYCTERGFLQRVGGGYHFVHGLLREHFAQQYGKH